MTGQELQDAIVRIEGKLDIALEELENRTERYELEKAAAWHRGYKAGWEAKRTGRSKTPRNGPQGVRRITNAMRAVDEAEAA